MRYVATTESIDAKHLVNGYAWADVAGGAVVDVYCARPAAIVDAGRQATEATLPTYVLSRNEFHGHDFMQLQSFTNGAVYLLQMISHDWPDHVAVSILKNLVPVLEMRAKKGKEGTARILIVDKVMPTLGQIPVSVERVVRVRDMTMMQVFNSRERALEQLRALLLSADEGLQLRQVVASCGSALSLLEVEVAEVVGVEEDGGKVPEDGVDIWEISG
ncbi:hypothetical protein F5Y16DRAFT_394183 [Xylariaceae sp. FL0255]|nr:hypothetical protein F5Y16DRAFT_394183 [Xylariaceae sp. FL0255]